MKYSSQKDINKAIRALVRDGWSFRRGSKHGKLRPPSGRDLIAVSVTPSGRNAIKIFNGNVKRAVGR
jgi:hypothetical protein